MNNKGQMELGVIMMVFITVLVGVVLLQSVAQEVGDSVNTVSAVNSTFTTGANGTRIDITGQELLSTPVVTNSSSALLVADQDYDMDEIVSTTTGVKTISFLVRSANASSQTVNITYDYGQDGYIDSSGGRAMANLIAIFFALAIAVVALSPTIRGKLADQIGK